MLSKTCSHGSITITFPAACRLSTGLGGRTQASSNPRPIIVSPGEKVEVSVFGIQAKGTKFVFVVDRSRQHRIGGALAAKAELLRGIEPINVGQQFQIILYNEKPKIFNPTGMPGKLAFGTDENKAEVRKFLSGIEADGGTDHEAALRIGDETAPRRCIPFYRRRRSTNSRRVNSTGSIASVPAW